MKWLSTERVVHDIEKGSNLDLLIRGFHGIGNRLVDAVLALAVALSTKEDNSKEIKEFAERIKTQVSALEAAAKQQSKGE
jgi:hypothetical protein